MIRLCLLLLLASTPLLFGNLETFPNCTLVPSEWADGDSFPVRFPDGKERTIRLYGVDCMEMHLQGDDSNARRLRDQRRYFGIADIQLWKHTDWDKLTAFRKEARDEVAEIEIAKDQQKADPANQIDLNTASRDELMTIPGIGETTANQIISARPFRQLGDLLKVPGIGTTKFQKFRPYLKVTPPKS